MQHRLIARLLVRRLSLVPPILFGILTFTFFVTRIVPGDPTAELAGPFAGPEQLANIRHQYGFDQPIWTQYFHYIGRLMHFDLGQSFTTNRSVVSDLEVRLAPTLELVLLSLGLAVAIGITAGSIAAWRRDRIEDRVIRGGSFIAAATPDFWLGLVLLYVFFFKLHLLPGPEGQLAFTVTRPREITGATLIDSVLTGSFDALRSSILHTILPVVTLTLYFVGPIIRLTRSSALEALQADYVRFGRAVGLSPFTIWRYVLRMALPSVVTLVGILFSHGLGAAVLVETIFSWGGIAQYAAQAILNNDYSVVQAYVLLAGVFSVVAFTVVDLLHMALDPRVRL